MENMIKSFRFPTWFKATLAHLTSCCLLETILKKICGLWRINITRPPTADRWLHAEIWLISCMKVFHFPSQAINTTLSAKDAVLY